MARVTLALFAILGYLCSQIFATALTYKLKAGEKACFFSDVPRTGSKIAFYFAVQSGGSFDVDYTVNGPNGEIIMQNDKERQVDAVFTAKLPGEYKFCFNNGMSTYTDKLVDFEIAVEGEGSSALLPVNPGTTQEQASGIEDSIIRISRELSTISRNQKYFRTRENRNFSTVKSTEARIFKFSIIESGLMVAMAGLQVFIVRFFFQGARKGYV